MYSVTSRIITEDPTTDPGGTFILQFSLRGYNKFFRVILKLGRGQNLEQLNVERPIFPTSKISNIKRTKDELFDFIIFDLKKELYIQITRTLKIYDYLDS